MIPVNEPILNGNEKKFLSECIDTGWISSEGPFVRKFEEHFSNQLERRFGIAVANGTAALDLAVSAINIGCGDEVILPAFTIISCINQIVRAGAKPVLVDQNPLTWNMEVNSIEAKITPRTKAIMVVHTYGLPADMDPILTLATIHGLSIIEDAAEAHGQSYRGQPCGSFGDISTFSFYPNKLITTGEGGMIVTDNEKIAAECRSLRNLCFEPEKRFVHKRLGWNARMTNLQAALGLAQLERIDEFIERKRRMGHRYTKLFSGIPGIELPLARTEYAENIFWVYGIVLKDEVPFDAIEAMKRLKTKGVGTRPFFWPMHKQPVFQGSDLFVGESYPVSERLGLRGFYVPSGLALTDSQMESVAEALSQVMR
jgi:perosamine synthetase